MKLGILVHRLACTKCDVLNSTETSVRHVHLKMELCVLLITENLLNISSHTNTGRLATNLPHFEKR